MYENRQKPRSFPATDCLVFEDSLNGVIAAKAARMKVIAVPEHSNTYNPKIVVADKIIDSLTDFDVETVSSFWD